MHYRKTNKPKLLLALVALLAVFAISIGITYSWIEGGTTYTIKSDDVNEPIKTDSVPDSVTYSGKITLNPAASNSQLTLVNYDENTNQYQGLYFSPVASADGENFLFPVSDSDGTVAFYRDSNINDVGTKYINYDFDVVAAKKCYLAFNSVPTITATKGGTTISDTSSLRFMIKCGGESHFFTTATENKESQVVTGTSNAYSNATLTAVPFADYFNQSQKKLASYEKGDEDIIEVSVWLDSGSDTTALQGCDISINLSLIVVAENVRATFNAVTYDKTGAEVTSNGFTGGSIKYGSTTYTNEFYKDDTSFTATAVPNSESYDFIGWYSDSDCTELISDNLSLPTQSPDTDVTYYAKFQERNLTTIYVEPRSGFSTYSVYAYCKYSDGTHHYTGTETTLTNNWPGATAALDSNTGYYKFEFTTTDVGTFNVIVSNNGGSQFPGVDVEGLVGNIGGTYLFTSDNTLIEFDPADMITIKAYGSTGGSGLVNGGATIKTRPGKSVQFTAPANSGYRFEGWYNYSTGAKVNSNATFTLSLTDAHAGSTIEYMSKFIKTYSAKAYAVTNGTNNSSTGGTVQVGTASAGASSTLTVDTGKTVTFKAVEKTGYEFKGWYTSATGGTLKSENSSYTVTMSANTTLYARFEKPINTIDVGVVYYLMERSTVTQVYYWCDDGTSATIDLTELTATDNSYSVGSSYWSGVAQKFYCYSIEVPDNITGIKFKNGNNWYGADVTNFASGKIDLIFEYDGIYHNYRTTK
ncbi:MAG: InlB B-repeat-containing protein [Clostridia bacterium]|nr:InlB B-repeat-containing protein [Clostridia bacterium]